MEYFMNKPHDSCIWFTFLLINFLFNRMTKMCLNLSVLCFSKSFVPLCKSAKMFFPPPTSFTGSHSHVWHGSERTFLRAVPRLHPWIPDPSPPLQRPEDKEHAEPEPRRCVDTLLYTMWPDPHTVTTHVSGPEFNIFPPTCSVGFCEPSSCW